jgi:hypothetical protein
MPYPQNSPRQIPTTREADKVEFRHADGQAENFTQNCKTVGSSQNADHDAEITAYKLELGCGCYFPEHSVAGVCAECARQQIPANVCKSHYVVCECGEPCCWKHSRLSEDRGRSLCSKCRLREKNKTMFKSLYETVCRTARVIFFRS